MRTRIGILTLSAVAVAALLTAGATTALAGTSAPAPVSDGRYGVFPMGDTAAAVSPAAVDNLRFRGGRTGAVDLNPRVYLIFWGSQWRTDTLHVQTYLQNFVKGLGTTRDTWSRVTTQYCQGVPAGTVNCGTAGQHPRFTGSVFAGTWTDTAGAAPNRATAGQIAAEAVRGARHFGNTTQAPNLNAQYVVVSPTGTHPDGFNAGAGFCAYHSSTRASVGRIAYTNMPYVRDAGRGCATNSVNPGAAGQLDGFSVVEGHEYAESVTDFFPGGGWLDSRGAENGDKCQAPKRNITLPTGTFAVQATWSNKISGCAFR
jgi:serine protease